MYVCVWTYAHAQVVIAHDISPVTFTNFRLAPGRTCLDLCQQIAAPTRCWRPMCSDAYRGTARGGMDGGHPAVGWLLVIRKGWDSDGTMAFYYILMRFRNETLGLLIDNPDDI